MPAPIYPALGVLKYTVSTSVVKKFSNPDAGTFPPSAVRCLVSVESNPIRFTDDGVDPSSSHGLQVAKDLPPFSYEGDLTNFKMLGQGGSAVVFVAFYGARSERSIL